MRRYTPKTKDIIKLKKYLDEKENEEGNTSTRKPQRRQDNARYQETRMGSKSGNPNGGN